MAGQPRTDISYLITMIEDASCCRTNSLIKSFTAARPPFVLRGRVSNFASNSGDHTGMIHYILFEIGPVKVIPATVAAEEDVVGGGDGGGVVGDAAGVAGLLAAPTRTNISFGYYMQRLTPSSYTLEQILIQLSNINRTLFPTPISSRNVNNRRRGRVSPALTSRGRRCGCHWSDCRCTARGHCLPCTPGCGGSCGTGSHSPSCCRCSCARIASLHAKSTLS